MTAAAPGTAAALRRGAALFDQGRFWDAHEAWEEAWLEEDGEVRLFLQGLIQVAAGYHKATVQLQPNGCVKLLRSGLGWQSGELASFPHQLIPRLSL